MTESDGIQFRMILRVARDLASLISSALRSRAQLAAENLFLKKQLALYLERQAKPRRADDATRMALVALSRFVDWRRLLTIVKPETLLRWHRKGFRLFWRWKSRRRGRPAIPAELRALIATMAAANRTSGEERIAAELLVKLGIRVSPRTVRRYMPSRPPRAGRGTQAWSTFVRNHAHAVLASDFFCGCDGHLRVLGVRGPRSRHATHRALERDGASDSGVDRTTVSMVAGRPDAPIRDPRSRHDLPGTGRPTLEAMGLVVLKTPVRVPQANAFCERLIGTMRRECLDFVIALSERHLRAVLHVWVAHYNRGCPHASLGPGIPESCDIAPLLTGHRLPDGQSVTATPILEGLHHEYRLTPRAA
jgi:transposase InsO family protein